ILISNNEKITEFFVNETVDKNLNLLNEQNSTGILNYKFNIPENAIFSFIEECYSKLSLFKESDDFEVSLTLYSFTNFAAKPDLNLYYIPANVFKFYIFCLNDNLRKDWLKFVNSYYYIKGGLYDFDTSTFKTKKKIIVEEEFKKVSNTILRNLLNNKNITYYFRKFSESYKFNLKIIYLYQILIKNMDKKTLEIISSLSDYIVKDNEFLNKTIKRLNGLKSASQFRQFLVFLVEKNYKENPDNKKALLTINDYSDYLFSEGIFWGEIRDILLIHLF
ncbi:MAG TPA: hypothetical protein DIS94_10090, partial [Bacteroidetes bacterium]|nr:hypothetical protein [Bacteroidota bacterium]